jgi:hypothetical protein
MAVDKNKDFYDFDNYVTELGEINRPETIAILNNYSVFYSLTKTDVFNLPAKLSAFNVYPCVPKNPVCRKNSWFGGLKSLSRKYIKL